MPGRLFLLPFALLAIPVSCGNSAERPNVLFIAVDDLRPELACYGKVHIHSPNIDRLANEGVLFERAYCMVPTCGASRASLMTGIRPSANRFVSYLASAQEEAPGITTWNTHFRHHGYYSASLGKVFHHPQDNAEGWSEPPWRPRDVLRYQLPENQRLHTQRQREGQRSRGPAWESADAPDNAYGDGVLAERAVDTLSRLSLQDQPFLLAVGFFKPHLPFVAPKKYWDLYDEDTIELPDNYHVPKNAPPESIHSSGELRAYAGIPPRGPVSDQTARKLIHGYYACVSYIDAQIGMLLDELERLELDENTIVVLWGDHGWNLGEHTLWCKHSCYETSLQIPLLVKAPGFGKRERRSELIETIDLYPSLCEIAGIPARDHLQGRSFAALMKDPNTPWKSTAVSRFGRGDTIRTDRFRFSEYTNAQGKPVANMLYDHDADPGENVNIADAESGTVAELTAKLHEQMGRD